MIAIEDGLRICGGCREEKPLAEFCKSKGTPVGRCRACRRAAYDPLVNRVKKQERNERARSAFDARVAAGTIQPHEWPGYQRGWESVR